jgi:hypothetical protein
MPLTIDELDQTEMVAYACDGEPGKFEVTVVPHLNKWGEGLLWALAGKFLHRHMHGHARAIAAYARACEEAAGRSDPLPDPAAFYAQWEAEEKEKAVRETLELPF